jgi:hypothetical protein
MRLYVSPETQKNTNYGNSPTNKLKKTKEKLMEFTFIKGQRGDKCLVYKGHKYTIYRTKHAFITFRCSERHFNGNTFMDLIRSTILSEIVHECTI